MEKILVNSYCPINGEYPKGCIVNEYADGSRMIEWPSDLEAQRKSANCWQKKKTKVVRVRNKTWL